MAGVAHTGLVGSDQSTHGNDFHPARNVIGIRTARLLCKASIVALGSSIVVQPAIAEPVATAPAAEQSPPTDATAPPGTKPTTSDPTLNPAPVVSNEEIR